MNINANINARMLVDAIEFQMPPDVIEQQANALIQSLGGKPDLKGTSPGATALYLVRFPKVTP